jgi:hypothetical protein|tara:strand:- start:656 stop:1030 length:375 start_codon:yes stop_codon:yes gene_type:complete
LLNEIAKVIFKEYDLYPSIVMDKDLEVKASFMPEEDKVILKDIPKEDRDPKDMIITLLHETKHMLDAKRIGITKFLKKYAQAGTVAVNCGGDYYEDNKWEIKAEKWAHKEYKRRWSNNKKEEQS